MCANPVHRLLVVTIRGSAKTLGSIRISYLNVRSRELLSFPARTTFWRGTGFAIGLNIPMVRWFPEMLREHHCHARIYRRKRLFSMAFGAGIQGLKCGY